MNTFGEHFQYTSFGESHGAAIGGVLDGVPAGIHIDLELIRHELLRRAGRTGDTALSGVSQRANQEEDEVEWLSGVMDGITIGSPIAFMIRNKNARPEDYEYLRHTFRPGHADYVYAQKYGIRDWRGGGRASARETAARVVAGCIARQIVCKKGISIHAELIQVGTCTSSAEFNHYLRSIAAEGDSIGGIVRCTVSGLKPGIGDPIFDKLQMHLAAAMMSINACKGFDYGTGFEGIGMRGSEANRYTGGIVGGISDGTTLVFRCVFKPTPSISRPQTIDGFGNEVHPPIIVKGRHDVCVAVRAVPVVEAMTALVLADLVK